jgi:hypothetical protein
LAQLNSEVKVAEMEGANRVTVSRGGIAMQMRDALRVGFMVDERRDRDQCELVGLSLSVFVR